MKKYLLTTELIQTLINGSKPEKELISSYLEELLQKNSSLVISTTCLNQIIESEKKTDDQAKILKSINDFCEEILILNSDYLSLAVSFSKEFIIDYNLSLEFITAKANLVDTILDISEKFKFQKTISVLNIILKTK